MTGKTADSGFTGNIPDRHNFVIRETGNVSIVTGEETTMNRSEMKREEISSGVFDHQGLLSQR